MCFTKSLYIVADMCIVWLVHVCVPTLHIVAGMCVLYYILWLICVFYKIIVYCGWNVCFIIYIVADMCVLQNHCILWLICV